ncbi:hypothetical protein M427DRAFT_265950 [Gonapodya prolifera JEL478]|uniref:Uncharacterized protein n=1 Tax=Gonapodya prolifera (strain JEL478) TaxID=1344416 RepID=A0A139AKN6_GONPJ|nr:hypothetical protein M427DRAFT_265950 [Gonapodya prolifera JEL478]|eukprot:KXS17258.1 hypothetical protein M427DRAFT_265950 [Gonapodya prolifera JEL478]
MAGVLGILQALPTLEKISQNLAGAAPLGPHLVQAAGTLALSIIIATLMSLHGTGLLGSLVSMAAGVILGASASYALAESRAGSERVGEFDAQARRNLFLILQTVAKVQQRLDAMPVDEPAAAGVAGIVGTPQPAPPIAPARESSSSTIYSTNNITLDQLATQYL